MVDYGDGSGAQSLTLSGHNFSLSHTYGDEGSYTVTVKVTDDDGSFSTKTATVVVNDLAPAVNAFAGATINEGTGYTSSGTFTDPSSDTWTATVDYGDGSGAQPMSLSGHGFRLSHTYGDEGSCTVT